MTMEHIKSHFEELIVEDQPLSTSSFGKAFNQFRGRFGEPVVEDKPLSTTPFGTTFDHIDGHFQEPIVEDQPLSTSSFGIPLGRSLEESRARGRISSRVKSAALSWTPHGSPKPPLGWTTRTLCLSLDRFESFGVHFGELIHEEIHLKTLSLWNAFCQALGVISGSRSLNKFS